MGQVPASEFMAKCLELIDLVEERRQSFVITKRGKPVARLVPVPRVPKDSIFGWLRGKGRIKGDITGPVLAGRTWEALMESGQESPPETPSRRKARKR
jgi:prevent-host-death family protein